MFRYSYPNFLDTLNIVVVSAIVYHLCHVNIVREKWLNCKIGGKGTLWRAREREPIIGVCRQSPQRSPGAEPLVRGQGSRPPEAEDYFASGHSIDLSSSSVFQYFTAFSVVQFLSHVNLPSELGARRSSLKTEGGCRSLAFPLNLTTVI